MSTIRYVWNHRSWKLAKILLKTYGFRIQIQLILVLFLFIFFAENYRIL